MSINAGAKILTITGSESWNNPNWENVRIEVNYPPGQDSSTNPISVGDTLVDRNGVIWNILTAVEQTSTQASGVMDSELTFQTITGDYNITINLIDDTTAGSETADYNDSLKEMNIHIEDGATDQAAIISAAETSWVIDEAGTSANSPSSVWTMLGNTNTVTLTGGELINNRFLCDITCLSETPDPATGTPYPDYGNTLFGVLTTPLDGRLAPFWHPTYVQNSLVNRSNQYTFEELIPDIPINYDNSTSGLTATIVQDAIDEIDGNIDTHISDTANPHTVTKDQVLSGDLIDNADISETAAITESKLNLNYATHSQQHDINSTSDHNGVSGATENNIIAFDNNGLPKDSGVSTSSITSGVTYVGLWNADTNTPTLGDSGSGGVQGDYYRVSVAGTTNIDGVSDWGVGDWILHNGTAWDKVDNSETVTSVNAQTGDVVLDAGDISYDNVLSGLTAVNTQSAIDEIITTNNMGMSVPQYSVILDPDAIEVVGEVYNTYDDAVTYIQSLPSIVLSGCSVTDVNGDYIYAGAVPMGGYYYRKTGVDWVIWSPSGSNTYYIVEDAANPPTNTTDGFSSATGRLGTYTGIGTHSGATPPVVSRGTGPDADQKWSILFNKPITTNITLEHNIILTGQSDLARIDGELDCVDWSYALFATLGFSNLSLMDYTETSVVNCLVTNVNLSAPSGFAKLLNCDNSVFLDPVPAAASGCMVVLNSSSAQFVDFSNVTQVISFDSVVFGCNFNIADDFTAYHTRFMQGCSVFRGTLKNCIIENWDASSVTLTDQLNFENCNIDFDGGSTAEFDISAFGVKFNNCNIDVGSLNFDGLQSVYITNCVVSNTHLQIKGGGTLNLTHVDCQNVQIGETGVTGGNLYADNCSLYSVYCRDLSGGCIIRTSKLTLARNESGNSLILRNCSIDTFQNTSIGTITIENCNINSGSSGSSSGSLTLNNSVFDNYITTAGNLIANNCYFGNYITGIGTGELTQCYVDYYIEGLGTGSSVTLYGTTVKYSIVNFDDGVDSYVSYGENGIGGTSTWGVVLGTHYYNGSSGLTAENTQHAIDEVSGNVDTHIGDTTNPHSVTSLQATYDNSTSGLTATTAQAAIDEVVDSIPSLPEVSKGIQSIDDTTSTFTVNFSPAFADTDYIVTGSLENKTDTPPSLYLWTITDKTTSSFDVLLSGDTDSANYSFNWRVEKFTIPIVLIENTYHAYEFGDDNSTLIDQGESEANHVDLTPDTTAVPNGDTGVFDAATDGYHSTSLSTNFDIPADTDYSIEMRVNITSYGAGWGFQIGDTSNLISCYFYDDSKSGGGGKPSFITRTSTGEYDLLESDFSGPGTGTWYIMKFVHRRSGTNFYKRLYRDGSYIMASTPTHTGSFSFSGEELTIHTGAGADIEVDYIRIYTGANVID